MTTHATTNSGVKPLKLNSATSRTLLVAAQVLALVVFILALIFLKRTTGGTLFLFSTIAPVLVMLGVAAVFGVVVYRFLRRHSLFEVEDIEPGQVIFREGEEGDCAYFIHDGEFAVTRVENAAEKVIARLSAGQYFGEMALIGNESRNATVRAVTPGRVAILGKQNFLTMLELMPHTQQDIMKTVNERAMRKAKK
jgi:CRP-like cAMP-binding protein